MAWLTDLTRLFGGGSSPTVTAAANNQTTVTVSPNIITAIDTAPLAEAGQSLVNALSGVTPAIASIGTAITTAAAKQDESTAQLRQITVMVAIAGIAFSLIRMVAAK